MPYGPVLMTLSLAATLLTLPPLAWHIKCINIPAGSLILWLFVMNLNTFISAAIWLGEDYSSRYEGGGYCDVVVKLQAGVNVGICSCVGALALNLLLILSAESLLLQNTIKRRVIEACMCWVTPVLIMATIFVTQDARYWIYRYSGCQYSFSATWVTTVMLAVPMLLWSVVSFVLAILTITKYLRMRKDVLDILHCTNSGLTFARFSRLLLFCILIVCVMLPVSLYFFAVTVKQIYESYSYNSVHDPLLWSLILFRDPGVPLYDRWIDIALAYLAFLIFGVGEDSVRMYKAAFRTLCSWWPCPLPYLKGSNRHAQETTSVPSPLMDAPYLTLGTKKATDPFPSNSHTPPPPTVHLQDYPLRKPEPDVNPFIFPLQDQGEMVYHMTLNARSSWESLGVDPQLPNPFRNLSSARTREGEGQNPGS